MTENNLILELKNVSKFFPGVVALKNVSFDLFEGEVHAIIGENGAGKTTLMKILAGVFPPDIGEIFINKEKINVFNPLHARKLGISMIYQNLNLIPKLTVAENIFLGNEFQRKAGFVDINRINKKASEILNDMGLDIKPNVELFNLSISQQQMVEVAKALALNTKIIVMDEPTSSLSQKEIELLFNIITNLKKKKVTVVYISHRFKEVFAISDRITVLKDGVKIKTFRNGEENYENIVQMMIGYKLEDFYHIEKAETGSELLEVKNLNCEGLFKDISFNLRRGEILGVFGLVGSGRTEIFSSIFGLNKDLKVTGDIIINKRNVTIKDPKDAIRLGIGMVPEDKKLQGIILKFSVRENISLINLRKFSKLGFINTRIEKQEVNKAKNLFSITTPNIEQKVLNLSGGNQQKVILTKWFMLGPRILILDEPTKGIDIGAKKEIHEFLSKFTKKGIGVIVISSEVPEILAISDRIMIIRDGKLVGIFNKSEMNEKKLLSSALGLEK